MSLPPQFQGLRALQSADVEAPDYVWLAYAVCAVAPGACGWGGWMIEAAFRRDGAAHATGTGDRALSAADAQVCPRCGRETFRTAAALKVVPAAEQAPPLRAGIDYDVAPETGEA